MRRAAPVLLAAAALAGCGSSGPSKAARACAGYRAQAHRVAVAESAAYAPAVRAKYQPQLERHLYLAFALQHGYRCG